MEKDNIQKMVWNEPGGSNGKDPWGNRNKKSSGTPPDVDEMLRKIKDKFSGSGGLPGGISFILIGAVLFWLFTGFYIIEEGTKGVELRFGKYITTTGSGLHWHLPYPIEMVEKVNVDKSRDIEIGYRSSSARNRGGDILSEALMLTGDENMVNIKFAVQYRIKSPENFLFKVSDPRNTLREVTQGVVRDVVGKNKLDFVLTQGKVEFVEKVRKQVQTIMDSYNSGVLITSVNMQDAQPPEQVQFAFEDVVKAKEDKQRFINQSEAYRNDILPRARGKAARIVAEANAYREQVVAKAEGESSRFSQILTEYKKAPEVTRERMYLETMEQVLGRTGKLITGQSGNNLMMLPLDKMLSGSNMLPKAQTVTPNSQNIIVNPEIGRKTRSLREGR